MNGAFSIKEMFLLGWPVLSVLILCSIVSLAVILERWVYFRKRKVNIHDFFGKIQKILSSKEIESESSNLGEPMATITRFANSYASSPKESLELAVDRAIRMQIGEAERFVPLLGTVAAAAPFIGLLGTVVGIIRAFRSLAMSGTGGPQIVASGIAEALVATAVGLMVAIPALVAYNYYSIKIRRMTEGMEICADGLVDMLLSREK